MNIKTLFLSLLLMISTPAFTQQTDDSFETLFWTSPNLVFDDQPFTVNFHFQHEYFASTGRRYSLEMAPDAPELSSGGTHLLATYTIPSPHIPYGPGMARATMNFEALPAGSYQISLETKNFPYTTDTFTFQVLERQHRGFRKINHESPAAGELVSGVGLIRGWACQEQGDIGEILFQIDNQDILSGSKQLKIPYGSERADTAEACSQTSESPSKTLNGYGAIINWNALSAGEHRFRLWVDGHLATDHMFSVAQTKAEFQKGLSREVSVSDFPNNGDSSLLQWSEADQNFILIETQKAE